MSASLSVVFFPGCKEHGWPLPQVQEGSWAFDNSRWVSS